MIGPHDECNLRDLPTPPKSAHTRAAEDTNFSHRQALWANSKMWRGGGQVITHSCLRLHKFCTGSEGLNAPSEKCLIEPHGRPGRRNWKFGSEGNSRRYNTGPKHTCIAIAPLSVTSPRSSKLEVGDWAKVQDVTILLRSLSIHWRPSLKRLCMSWESLLSKL